MIPIYLTIQGLYSYKEQQEVDFSRLTETSIFGIFGKVGSGKSSILEAITYALYGETDRLNKSGDDRNYNMMNLRSDTLLIDYICRAGAEGNKYRFTVKGRRNSKRFEQVNTFERKAYQWMDELDDWAPLETDQAAEKIIGLSYDNFKRTIIIPQGKFQDFLDLPQAQRTRMMNEIFQLNRYDLADKVKILKGRNDNQLDTLSGQLAQLGQTTPDVLAQSRHDLKNTQALIKTSDQQLKALADDERSLETLRHLFTDKEIAHQKIAALTPQEAGFADRAGRLERYQACRNTFQWVLDQKQIREKDRARDASALQQKEAAAEQIRGRIETERTKLQELAPQYEKREQLKQETEELGLVLQLVQSREDRAELEQKIVRGKAAVLERKDTIGVLTRNKEEIETALEKARTERVDMEVLAQVAEWFTKKNALLSTREVLKGEAKTVADEVEKLAAARSKIAAEPLFKKVFAGSTTGSLPGLLQEKLEAEKEVMARQAIELDRDILHLKTQRALRQYADALQPGEPCPLCGAEHHPKVLGGANELEKELRAVEDRQSLLRGSVETFEATRNQLSALEKEIAFYDKQKRAIREKWEENKAQLAAHDTLFVWNNFANDDEEAVKGAFVKAKEQKETIQKLEEEYKKKEREVTEARTFLEDQIQFALQRLEKQLAARLAETDTYRRQITHLDPDHFVNQKPEQIQYQIHAQNTTYARTVEAYESLTKQIQTYADQQNVLSGEIGSLRESLKQQENALKELEGTFQEALRASDFADEQDVLKVLQWKLDIPTEQKAVEEFKLTLNRAQAEIQALEEKTNGLRYDAEIHQKVKADLDVLTTRLNELRKEEGGLTNQLKKQQEDLAAQATLRQDKDQLEVRGKDIDTLTKLFKASGFVSFVSAMYLQNLCNQANARFHKMTRHQLQLELYEPRPAEYDFQVRDLLNEGRTRAVKTLSGGQKFQVALALALALADQIHAQSHALHNFFFLDEGFGSLDKDSLGEVFETLQSLRRENRIVGVISHVEDLQQEIQNHLKIEMTEQGSVVIPNW